MHLSANKIRGDFMLKNIPPILSPELLKVLCEMGHGDTLVLADGNFPSASVGRGCIVIRADGHGVPELLRAILQLFPLDTYADKPVSLMAVMPGDNVATPIWDEYYSIVSEADKRGKKAVREVERFAFYEEAKKAYAVVATGEKALYANVILQKGVC
jgi:L-fucose mutarotase